MIVIKSLDPSNLSDAGQCDGLFLVDNKLVLCGFELAGFDRHLYHGQNINPIEIALYWYWHPETPSDPPDER